MDHLDEGPPARVGADTTILINLTPYLLYLTAETGETIVIPAGDKQAYVSTQSSRLSTSLSVTLSLQDQCEYQIPINRITGRTIRNLPEPQPNTAYVVLPQVARLAHRMDVLVPDDLSVNPEGKVICANAIAAAWEPELY